MNKKFAAYRYRYNNFIYDFNRFLCLLDEKLKITISNLKTIDKDVEFYGSELPELSIVPCIRNLWALQVDLNVKPEDPALSDISDLLVRDLNRRFWICVCAHQETRTKLLPHPEVRRRVAFREKVL